MLTEVIAVYGGQGSSPVYMDPTLAQAVADVFGTAPPTSPTKGSTGTQTGGSESVSAKVQGLIAEANSLFQKSQSDLKNEDLGAYENDVKQLGIIGGAQDGYDQAEVEGADLLDSVHYDNDPVFQLFDVYDQPDYVDIVFFHDFDEHGDERRGGETLAEHHVDHRRLCLTSRFTLRSANSDHPVAGPRHPVVSSPPSPGVEQSGSSSGS